MLHGSLDANLVKTFRVDLFITENDNGKYIAECTYLNVASVLGINGVHCQFTYGTIGGPIIANSYCRVLLRKRGGLYELVEYEHRAARRAKPVEEMVREGTELIPGFDDEEVAWLLDMLCCDIFDA